MTEEKIKSLCYTKEEVDAMIAEAVAEARRIDEASMAKHNREATIISMILGFTCLALFLDGLLRILGIIPPFMHLDVNIIDKMLRVAEEETAKDNISDQAKYLIDQKIEVLKTLN